MNRRALLHRATVAGLGLGAAACGATGGSPLPQGGPTPSQGPAAPPAGLTERAVTLRYLTWYGGDRRPTTDAWIAAFNQEWPRATVEVEEVTLADFPTKFQTQLAGGTPPDLVVADSHAQSKWFDTGAHLDPWSRRASLPSRPTSWCGSSPPTRARRSWPRPSVCPP
jgi:ABC-type glycerol-3-phosphate transport system substrate-binding protein